MNRDTPRTWCLDESRIARIAADGEMIYLRERNYCVLRDEGIERILTVATENPTIFVFPVCTVPLEEAIDYLPLLAMGRKMPGNILQPFWVGSSDSAASEIAYIAQMQLGSGATEVEIG